MIRLSIEVKDKLRSIAKELDMPMAQVVNMLLNKWIKENKQRSRVRAKTPTTITSNEGRNYILKDIK